MNCSFSSCLNESLLRNLCQSHFVAQFVQPLQKERDNSQRIIDQLNTAIKALLEELGLARRETSPRFNGLLRQTSNGVTNSTKVFCHNCWQSFESGIDVVMHEAECRAPKARKPHAARAKVAQSSTLVLDDLGDCE